MHFLTTLWRRLEFKLILAWLIVLVATICLEPHGSISRYPNTYKTEIIRTLVVLGTFSLGAAVIIISGGIDLSSGSTVALSSTIFVMVLKLMDPVGFENMNVDIKISAVIVAIAATLVLGFFIGTFHAWLITRVGLSPFIATLSTLVGLRSLAQGLIRLIATGGQLGVRNEGWLTSGFLNSQLTLVVTFLILALLFWVLMSKTVVGRQLHAMGGNEQAAILSGMRTDRLKWFAYCLGSMTACITGLFTFGYLSTASPERDAYGYELNAIAACVIGGCSLKGGTGTVPGVVIGCLFISTVIDSIGRFIDTNSQIYQGLIIGTVIIVAVAFSQGNKSQKKYFSDAIGWISIPFIGFLSGCIVYFLTQLINVSVIFATVVCAFLIIRALWERQRIV